VHDIYILIDKDTKDIVPHNNEGLHNQTDVYVSLFVFVHVYVCGWVCTHVHEFIFVVFQIINLISVLFTDI
jgi:hypothetical protein